MISCGKFIGSLLHKLFGEEKKPGDSSPGFFVLNPGDFAINRTIVRLLYPGGIPAAHKKNVFLPAFLVDIVAIIAYI